MRPPKLLLILFVLRLTSGIVIAGEPGVILKTEEPVVIDGIHNEPCWKHATRIRADYRNSKQGALSDEPRLAVMFAWDERFLYVAYDWFHTSAPHWPRYILSTGPTSRPTR